ncbi:MAG: hypothetical protein NC231_04615 [Bacillus sp. (in: Bacteria)]|nr:hypothetical protein [Bacillus sp. (in: firmicutes)]MCM1427169.1 hypothetical protein [Eubacterium sp.]
MPHQQTNSSKAAPRRKHNTNWHEAAACAVQIELRKYAHLLDFQSEYILGKNNYRIDLLIIKKLCKEAIPKNIACVFKTYNLFEIKGIGSSVNTDAYYKTIGYAGLLIDQSGKKNQYTALDISLSFLCFHYPKSLMRHLQKDRKLVVENFSKGVYHIINEIFNIQIIVTKELPPEDNLYLHCLTDKLSDAGLLNRLIDDYQHHRTQEIYIKYMNQLTNANSNEKGDSSMFEEMMERAKQEAEAYYTTYFTTHYAALLDTLNNKIEQLSSSNAQLSSQNDYLKTLLRQNNIQFQ